MGILVGNIREGKMSRKEQAIVYITVEITGGNNRTSQSRGGTKRSTGDFRDGCCDEPD